MNKGDRICYWMTHDGKSRLVYGTIIHISLQTGFARIHRDDPKTPIQTIAIKRLKTT